MFHAVHTETAGKHQDENNEKRGNDLVPLLIQDGCNYVKRVIFGIQPEQMEDSGNPQHPEEDKAGQEEGRNDRQKINDSVKGKNEFQPGSCRMQIRIKIVCGPDPESVLNAEDSESDPFHDLERGKQAG